MYFRRTICGLFGFAMLGIFSIASAEAQARKPVFKPSAIVGGFCTRAFVQEYNSKVGIRIKSIGPDGHVAGFIGGWQGPRSWRQHFGARASATFRNGILQIQLVQGDIYSLRQGGPGRLIGDYTSPQYGHKSGVVFSARDTSCYHQS